MQVLLLRFGSVWLGRCGSCRLPQAEGHEQEPPANQAATKSISFPRVGFHT
jgi:hypothetical protein